MSDTNNIVEADAAARLALGTPNQGKPHEEARSHAGDQRRVHQQSRRRIPSALRETLWNWYFVVAERELAEAKKRVAELETALAEARAEIERLKERP